MELESSARGTYGAPAQDWSSLALEERATLVECEVDDIIYRSEDPAYHWYCVLAGAARRFSLRRKGRRQIVDFLIPGDVFGFGSDATYAFSTEAISSGTTLLRYPRRDAEDLAESERQVGRWIRDQTLKSISRLEWSALTTLRSHRVIAVCSARSFTVCDRGSLELATERDDEALALGDTRCNRARHAMNSRKALSPSSY